MAFKRAWEARFDSCAWLRSIAGLGCLIASALTSPVSAQETVLLLFGGRGHQAFLGCLNCSESSRASIFNQFSDFGSPYSRESIWNKFGDYGQIFGDHSACNQTASDPPVIVDRDGNYYGRLSVAEFLGHEDSVCNTGLGRFSHAATCRLIKSICR